MGNVSATRHFGPLDKPAAPAQVILVGAGPGDPELLTLKAARVLAEAQLVLYDNLVSPQVLAMVAPDAQCIYVGKRSSHHSLPQEGIIELMLDFARAGRRVVRLKGGDPYVFGRGGEEAEALAHAGIAFEVIPGISAAQGAAASAGIPLTHRDHAARVVWVTGHLREGCEDGFDLDWPTLARPRQTLVIYMGLAALPVLSERLVDHGLSPLTPAAIIERATLPEQRTLCGTLVGLPALAASEAVRSPALIMVGEVVRLHPLLHAHAQQPLAVSG
ncbi:MAG: uroporphyrinogen-III C-methyltransferase [Pseudomonadota bacterium]